MKRILPSCGDEFNDLKGLTSSDILSFDSVSCPLVEILLLHCMKRIRRRWNVETSEELSVKSHHLNKVRPVLIEV